MKTPKKSPVAAAASSKNAKVKKNVNYTPIRMKLPPAAPGGIIDSLQTAVEDIVISIVTSSSNAQQGAYIKPHTEAFKNGDEASKLWYVDAILPRRDQRRLHENEPMEGIQGRSFYWNCIVTLRQNPDESPSEIGHKLAASFSSFSSKEYEAKTFKFRSDVSEEPPLPLNHYLLDSDVVMYLKKIFFGTSKEDILQDEEILNSFFGSVSEGERVLSELSSTEWNSKMWFD